LPQRSATALYAKGGWVCIQNYRGSRRHRWGLIVLLHFRLGGLHPIQIFAVWQGGVGTSTQAKSRRSDCGPRLLPVFRLRLFIEVPEVIPYGSARAGRTGCLPREVVIARDGALF